MIGRVVFTSIQVSNPLYFFYRYNAGLEADTGLSGHEVAKYRVVTEPISRLRSIRLA